MIETQSLQQPTTTIESKPKLFQRITSIDILRALTMVLMIFVNDLWSLKNIPALRHWLSAKHFEKYNFYFENCSHAIMLCE